MVRASSLILGVVALTSASVSAQYFTRYDQEKQNRDATCGNNCFFRSMSGSCADDPACVCNQDAKRDTFYCCMAKNCDSNVLPEAIWRHLGNCDAFGIPIPEEFDVPGVCGIPWTLTTSTRAVATPTPEPSSAETGEASAGAATEDESSASAKVTTDAGSEESDVPTTAAPASTSPASSGTEAPAASDAAASVATPGAGAGPVQPGFGVLAAALGVMFW